MKETDKMKKYKAVIMDFDMTIADTGDLIEECLYTNALRFGYDLDRKILRNGIGLTAETIYRNAGVSGSEAKRLHDEYFPYSADIMCEKTKFFPGVAEGLGGLHSKGILLSILSLKSSRQILAPLEREGIDGLIFSVVGPDEVAKHKPDPEGIYYISKKTGIALEDILYAGDSFTDRKTAENAGVDFAAICSGSTSAEDFAANGAENIYSDFREMCRAIIESKNSY